MMTNDELSRCVKVTIGIKALNEEKHIENSIRSALSAAALVGGEVVLADSGSTDRTIEIATKFPIIIVQLENSKERSCGAGAQLAFQFSKGEYFYLLDGDMVLSPDFIAEAIQLLDTNETLAAVGGQLKEMSSEQSFQILRKSIAAGEDWRAGEVKSLNGGGLYRRSAVLDVGYFADQNLHGFEEAELGIRLRHKGWKLARLDMHAVDHFGHTMGGYKLLLRRILTGYSGGVGEVLRSAIGQPHLAMALASLSHLKVSLVVVSWWISILTTLILPVPVLYKLAAIAIMIAAPLLYLVIRRSSLSLGLYSFAAWNVTGLGFLQGLRRPRRDPGKTIAARIISSKSDSSLEKLAQTMN